MIYTKEEMRSRNGGDFGDRRRREKKKAEKGVKIKGIFVKRGTYVKISLSGGTSIFGKISEVSDKELRLAEVSYRTERAQSLDHEVGIRTDEIEHIELMTTFLKKEGMKESTVVVKMVSGTFGYGELVEESQEKVVVKGFTFFSDRAISYDITIKKIFIESCLKLSSIDAGTKLGEVRSDLKSEVKGEVKGEVKPVEIKPLSPKEKERVKEPAKEPAKEQIKDERGDDKFLLDSEIRKKKVGRRELQPFYQKEPKEKFGFSTQKGEWNQFKANEIQFGMKATFDESMYTTVLDRNSEEYKMYAEEAERIAQRMMQASSSNLHIEEERGRISDKSEDEKYGSASDKPYRSEEAANTHPHRRGRDKEEEWKRVEDRRESRRDDRRDERRDEKKAQSNLHSQDISKEHSESSATPKTSQVSSELQLNSSQTQQSDQTSQKPAQSLRSVQEPSSERANRKTEHAPTSANQSPTKTGAPAVSSFPEPNSGLSEDYSSKVFQDIGEKTIHRKTNNRTVTVSLVSGNEEAKALEKEIRAHVAQNTGWQKKEAQKDESSAKEEEKPGKIQNKTGTWSKNAEKPATSRKLNAGAKSFDPCTAARKTFFIQTSKSKNAKENCWVEKEFEEAQWGSGPSFRSLQKIYHNNDKKPQQ